MRDPVLRAVQDQQQEAAQSGGEQTGPGPVDRRNLAIDVGFGHVPGEHHDRHDGERHADQEDPAPADVVGQVAADERAGDAREAPDGAEEPLDLRPLVQGEQVAQHGQHDRPDRAGPQPLDRPHRDQLAHRLRRPREDRAQAEEHQAEQEDALAAVEVRQLAVDRRADRRRQQIGRDHPGVDLEALELGDDRRHGRRDDQLLHRRDRHGDQERRGDHPAAGEGRSVTLFIRSGCVELRFAGRRRHVGPCSYFSGGMGGWDSPLYGGRQVGHRPGRSRLAGTVESRKTPAVAYRERSAATSRRGLTGRTSLGTGRNVR